jgi:phenylacetate-CoA ligase
MTLSEFVYKSGIRVRNKKILTNLDFLLRSQCWSRDRLCAYQNEKLKALLRHAYHGSPYYRKRFEDYQIDVEKVQCIDDLKSLPPIAKEDLLANAQAIQTNCGEEKLFYSETSGSSGKPLVFYRNQNWDAWHNASVFRGYSWYGIQPWERNGYLWGYNFTFRQKMKTMVLDVLQNRFRLFTYDDDEIERFCKKLRGATYLNGYSSMIYELAKHINKKERLRRGLNLKFVKGTSEKIYDSYQKEVRKAFGSKTVSEYGAAEGGIIAFECPSGSMHVNMETVIVEVVDDEIVLTNLISDSFPIIRYRLGDYIRLNTARMCECGRRSFIIEEVTGRVGKNIYGKSNKYPSLTLYYIAKNLAINHGITINYQAEQKEKGALLFKIDTTLSDRQRKLLNKEIIKYFQDDMETTVAENVNFVTKNEKLKDFISHIE